MSTVPWIATRDLKMGRKKLQARIGAPVVDGNAWRCDLALGKETAHACGEDALQALTLAVEKLRRMCSKHPGLDWLEMGVGLTRMIPIYLPPPALQRLEALVDKEERKWGRAMRAAAVKRVGRRAIERAERDAGGRAAERVAARAHTRVKAQR